MSDLIKYQGNNGIIKSAEYYLSYLNTLLQKRYAPDLPELIPYRKGIKWGFCNRDKKVIIECKYSHVFPFSEDVAFFRKNEKWGLVNLSGDEIELAECDSLESGRFCNGISSITYSGKSFLIDKSGNLIVEGLSKFKEGMALSIHDDKYGFVNDFGEITVSHKYDYALDFDEGLAKVVIDGKSGFIDKNGIEVIPLKYYHYDYQTGDYENGIEQFNEGLALVWIKYYCGFIDKSGKKITEVKYHYGSSFKEGRALVKFDDKKGYIDYKGCEVIPLIYDYAKDFSEGLALVWLNGRKFFIDKDGNEVFSVEQYNNVESFSEGLAFVQLNGKSGFINKMGHLVIPLKFSNYSSFHKEHCFKDGLARVTYNGKDGFIDKQGHEVIQFIYEPEESYQREVINRLPYHSDFPEFYAQIPHYIEPKYFKFIHKFQDGLAWVESYKAYDKTVSKMWSGYIDKLENEYWED